MWPRVLLMIVLVASAIMLFFLFNRSGVAMPEKLPPLDSAEVLKTIVIVQQPDAKSEEYATFGSGCFWCTEAVFQMIDGVKSVTSGYSGGPKANPSYAEVCTGTSGHAEVVQIAYDPKVVSYTKLLEVFWLSHDPTTRNQQGNDHGPQYRSVVFTHSAEQKALAEAYLKKIDESGVFTKPVVTEITAYSQFYPAELSHQNYFSLNARQPYCQIVIQPKIDKIRKVFSESLKTK